MAIETSCGFNLNSLMCFRLFLLYSLFNPSVGLPSSTTKRHLINDNVQQYLMKYGYLPMSDFETGNLRTEKQLRHAIRTMQRFGNIPQTGLIDKATKLLMRTPRCSLPDISDDIYYEENNKISNRFKRYIKQGYTWKKNNLTWGIRTFPEKIRDRTRDHKQLSRYEITREFRLATQIWGGASRLNFIHLEDNPEDADIIIDFKRGYHGDGYPFDGPGRTLAHAFYPGDEAISGDMHFDAEEDWVQHKDSQEVYEQISLFITAAHELGHALGLYHSDIEGALMSPYLVKFPVDFTLPQDDTRGIQELYGIDDNWAPSERRPTFSPTYSPSVTPSPPRRKDGSTEKPNTCDTEYDAISVIRREIYIFKGKYFWRVDGKGRPRPNYPAEILLFWPMLPKNLTHIDAVYERYNEGYIIFFIGQRYYVCQGNQQLMETGPLRKLGLPANLEKIDAVFIWGHNGMTYFFADTMYWRFDESISHVELDYPRDMAMWRGVPYYIDSAFKFSGTTYFFKGRMFWEFDDLRMKKRKNSPLLSAPFWFNCPNSFESPYVTQLKPTSGQINMESRIFNVFIIFITLKVFYFMPI